MITDGNWAKRPPVEEGPVEKKEREAGWSYFLTSGTPADRPRWGKGECGTGASGTKSKTWRDIEAP
jgi:hypothetical protein